MGVRNSSFLSEFSYSPMEFHIFGYHKLPDGVWLYHRLLARRVEALTTVNWTASTPPNSKP